MEKILPETIEAEKGILGAMLLKEGEIIPEVASILTVEDFYRPEHQIIYKHMTKLWSQGVAPNLITLRESMRQTGEMQKVGASLLISLADLEFTTAYAEEYARMIKEKSTLRRIIQATEKISEDAYGNLKTVEEILSNTEGIIKDIRATGVSDNVKLINGVDYTKKLFQKDVSEVKKFVSRQTGFENLDAEQIFSPGLYVLGGLPALGKTTFAWQLLYQLAMNGEKCIYCSYEMARLELYTKTYAAEVFKIDAHTKLTSTEIQRGGTSLALESVVSRLQNTEAFGNLNVIELQDETIDDVLRWLKQICARTEKSPVVCLDYLQIVPHNQNTAKEGIDVVVHKLKNFQRETNTTFIVISSFNRLNYMQSVSFESFKESGNIEYSADVVWGLQFDCANSLPKEINKAREVIDQAKRENPRKIQLRCLKNRKGINYDCYFEYYPANDLFVANNNFNATDRTKTIRR